MPGAQVFARLAHQQAVHGDDEAGFVGYGNKLSGHHHAFRALPASKSFKAGDLSGLQGNNRLVVSGKFAEFDRLAEICFQS